jgi:phage protein D
VSNGILRKPRCWLAVAGATIMPIECSVHLSAHQSADTFSATIALDDPSGLDEHFWADVPKIDAAVLATNDANLPGLVTLISGPCDHPEIHWDARTVHVSGRDKTAQLLDQKTNEKWQNKSAKDIITDLAGRGGLSVQFQGGATRAGLEFKTDRNRISNLDSAWNVIVRLARQEGCIAFVKGTTLYIQPIDAATGAVTQVFYQRPTPESYANGTFVTLTTSRDLNLAKGVKLNHRSWRHQQGDMVESEYEASGAGGTLTYRLRGANLQKDQQDTIAQARLKEIISHERKITVDLPGDVTIDPTGMIQLAGTGTGYDQAYLISDVEHHFSEAGFRSTVSSRNKDSKRSIKKNK